MNIDWSLIFNPLDRLSISDSFNLELNLTDFLARSLHLISAQGAQLALNELSNQFTVECSVKIFATTIKDARGQEFHGYSMGSTSDAQIVSIAEAVERFAYSESVLAGKLRDWPIETPTWRTNCVTTSGIPAYDVLNRSISCIPVRIALADNPNFPVTSSGNAVHVSIKRAYSAGLLELWERHILMKNWMLALAPSQSDSSIGISTSMTQFLAKKGFSSELWYYGSEEKHPICIRCIRNRSGGYPAAFFGTGTGASLEAAAQASTSECIRLWAMNYFLIEEGRDLKFGRVDQAIAYYDPDNLKILDERFFYAKRAGTTIDEPKNVADIEQILNPYMVILAPFTEAVGIPAVRVLSPVGVPLFFGHEAPIFPPHPNGVNPMYKDLLHPY